MGGGADQVDVLLDQQHRERVVAVEFRDHVRDLLNNGRLDPFRRLVEEQDARLTHQDPPDGEQLLLTAAEGAGPLPAPLSQAGEPLIDPPKGSLGTPAADQLPHAQVLLDREPGEYAAPLGHIAHAQARTVACIRTGDVAAAKGDAALHDRQQARDGFDQRRLADAVAADNRDDLARAHLERDLADNGNTAIARCDGIECQFHTTAPTTARPRGGRRSAATIA